jgi:hypothetical protein
MSERSLPPVVRGLEHQSNVHGALLNYGVHLREIHAIAIPCSFYFLGLGFICCGESLGGGSGGQTIKSATTLLLHVIPRLRQWDATDLGSV